MHKHRMAGQAGDGVCPHLRDPFGWTAADRPRLVSGKCRDGGTSVAPAGGAPAMSRACFTK